ncbi:zinc finger domain-containing protein [Bradyrhizobium erythrophlei]|uniref:zinc finger domain-containing protein n=1 Tax=Bradyrhizobium erythrophlei TaxID=1437360 RepID=UPI001560C56B|nr:zinc finger domain-containing protein [Bradyrhizobium erythrophlei]
MKMKKPIIKPSENKCPECMGAGYVSAKHPTRPGVKTYTVCKECKGKGRLAAD